MREDNITVHFEETTQGVDRSDLARDRQVAESCEKGDERAGSTKCGEFLDQLRDYQLLKRDSAPWNYFVAADKQEESML